MFKIRHATLDATINPVGAELSSLLTRAGSETLWQGDETFWGGIAPILFPIVGSLKDGKMIHRGQQYKMPRHGIARHATFECIDHSAEQLSMCLKADDTTRAVYPWDFELQVHFALSEYEIAIRYEVFNRDTTAMYFTIGSHPAFALEINNNTKFTDYAISFNQTEKLACYPLTEEGLLEATPRLLAARDNSIVLSNTIFNDDALVIRDIKSTAISLLRRGKTQVTIDTGGAPHLGLWSKPGAPFVCIEPWFGTSDFVDASGEFARKPDLTTLAPDQSFSHTIKITLPESR